MNSRPAAPKLLVAVDFAVHQWTLLLKFKMHLSGSRTEHCHCYCKISATAQGSSGAKRRLQFNRRPLVKLQVRSTIDHTVTG